MMSKAKDIKYLLEILKWCKFYEVVSDETPRRTEKKDIGETNV